MYRGFPLLVESQFKRIPTFGVKKRYLKSEKLRELKTNLINLSSLFIY